MIAYIHSFLCYLCLSKQVFNIHILDLDTCKAAGLTVGKLCELMTRNDNTPIVTSPVAVTAAATATQDVNKDSAVIIAAAQSVAALDSEIVTPIDVNATYNNASYSTNSSTLNSPSAMHFTSNHNNAFKCTHHKTRPNRAALYDSGVCDVIVLALNHHLTDATLANILCRTISIVAFGSRCSLERTMLGQLGACKAVTNAIQFHEGI